MAKASAQLGSLPRDRNGIAIQVGFSFSTSDATGTPQVSPLAFSTAVITIVVPDTAVEMVCMPTTDMRISELVGMAQYDVIKANIKEVIGCAKQQNIYIKRDSADGSLNFRFTLLGS